MKKFYIAFILLLFLNIIFLTIGKEKSETNSVNTQRYKIGLVFDVGGRGDKSFNDAAYNGLQKALRELNVEAEYIEPGEGADRESAIRLLAASGFDLIIGVGFIFTDDINNMAREYPKIKFACIDMVVFDNKTLPNVAAIKFREEEGSYLIGAISTLITKTGKIGFVGGMDIPLIHKFAAGYREGAKAINPNIEVIVNYAGVTGAAFKDPAKGKELAMSQFGSGCDIIYHASGSTGLGVFEAARSLNKLAIGVDADQYKEAPGFILTSMVKNVDVSVFDTIKDLVNGNFTSGIKSFGLKENGVGFVYNENNKRWITEKIYRRVNEIRESIIRGEIIIPIE